MSRTGLYGTSPAVPTTASMDPARWYISVTCAGSAMSYRRSPPVRPTVMMSWPRPASVSPTAVPSLPDAPIRRIFMPGTLRTARRRGKCPPRPHLCSGVMNVELRHLRVLAAIGDEGTFTDAAAGLRISQPAVSRTLDQLERRTGAQLVERTTRHLAG